MIVIVPGLIHAGTTYMAERLHLAGIDMGLDCCTKQAEHGPIHEVIIAECRKQCNSGVLGREMKIARGAWDWHGSAQLVPYLRRYREARDKASDGNPWGFKHPSANLFLPAFMEVFPDARWVVCGVDHQTAIASRMRRVDELTEWVAHHASVERKCVLATLVGNRHWWNRATPHQETESVQLSEYLGIEVDLHTHWKPPKSTV